MTRFYNIVIVGIGYVGSTEAACLLRQGHRVAAIDIDSRKLENIVSEQRQRQENSVENELHTAYLAGLLVVDTELNRHATAADMIMICVDTPATLSGMHDVSYLLNAVARLGEAIADMPRREAPLLCVIRSTVAVGTTANLVVPVLQESAKQPPGEQYEVLYHPEFLREASAVSDYFQPAKIVVGERVAGASGGLMSIYDQIDAPKFAVSFELAELIKTLDNSFHALKASFANEVGRIALSCNLDVTKLFEMFLADTKLNISPAYLRPGGAFGGPCLTKDLTALRSLAQQKWIEDPILQSIIESNEQHKHFIVEQVSASLPPSGCILLIGLTFNAGTDDLRGSPLVELALSLLDRGYNLRIYDFDLVPLLSANIGCALLKERSLQLPALETLLFDDITQALADDAVELLVIGKSLQHQPDLSQRLSRSGIPTIDLPSFVWQRQSIAVPVPRDALP